MAILNNDILKDSLTGTVPNTPATPSALMAPNLTGNNKADIASLQSAQKTPQALLNLQKAMMLSSQVAYRERQAQELGQAGQQFDPTKVSGGTFANIIGNLEQQRGTDVSRIYQSTMGTYRDVQQQVTSRLQYLQELEESKRRWEAEQKARKKELEYMKKKDKQAYKMEKEKFEMDKKSWELAYNKAKSKGGSAGGASYKDYEIMQSIQDLANTGHGWANIAGALSSEQIPTYKGSTADKYLNSIFGTSETKSASNNSREL